MSAAHRRARLRPADRLRVGLRGLIARPGRTALTAIGIGIGIASMITVVGISASSRADLLAELDELGTDLLQVRPGQNLFGDEAVLPEDATPMLRAVPTVNRTAGVSAIATGVQRNRHADHPNGLSVVATDGAIGETLAIGARRAGE